jgi:short-subunit dehydrogenase|tara:strand:+ start:548 stop:1270 length:723 start_codon:yes stop_codon:yes gene_type:complete
MNNSIFEGKNCLVTGATGGLGKAICKQLSERGCNIFLTSKTRSKLVQLKKNLSKHKGIKIEFENGDLTSISDVNKIIRKSNKKFNHIDILINCAGIFPVKKLSESTFQDFQECFDLNVRAPFLLTKEFVKQMKKNKWGRIVNVGSSSAYDGFENTSIYCATKHALLGFSRSIQKELKEKNIRVFFIAPGSIKTNMGKKVKGQDYKTFLDPDEIAEYIIFLISFNKNLTTDEIMLKRMWVK